jgi:hypothetical protein
MRCNVMFFGRAVSETNIRWLSWSKCCRFTLCFYSRFRRLAFNGASGGGAGCLMGAMRVTSTLLVLLNAKW